MKQRLKNKRGKNNEGLCWKYFQQNKNKWEKLK